MTGHMRRPTLSASLQGQAGASCILVISTQRVRVEGRGKAGGVLNFEFVVEIESLFPSLRSNFGRYLECPLGWVNSYTRPIARQTSPGAQPFNS